ncbi:MAG: hypothetical protein M1834_005240 [Cirrosporium novae-zelandiae]|nr:MAG: hypothetical protein M1834_005240 [Cirrosporium novae-zelandiae]
MARKARQRINYVLPLANTPGGHRLGVNGLAVDPDHSILYSGGRDGVICAWDLNLDLKPSPSSSLSSGQNLSDTDNYSSRSTAFTVFRHQTQAHTHWVNDLILVQNNSALVSASSDLTVKVWRPQGQDEVPAQNIGLHSDYVKCLASPSFNADWVASGGLDHKICLWDLNGAGEKLQINVAKEEIGAKGSIYALSARGSILASGGPESVLKLWDPKTGERINKFVGHTDNIRAILINEAGDLILSASSDQTVKVWSVTAGRCMHTLTMHNDSVWSLFSDHPDLSVFYSSDRSGLVAKTDARGASEIEEGISVAVCQEHDGIHKIVAAGDYIWTASASSSINRWKDVDTQTGIQDPPGSPFSSRNSIPDARSMSSPTSPLSESSTINGISKKQIPFPSLLRLSNAAPFPFSKSRDADTSITSGTSIRSPPSVLLDSELPAMVPAYSEPDETIEGQHGLIKHTMLNDRRRVLTLDTAGEVIMWDLVTCRAIKSFGKRHLEDVTSEVNTMESVNTWCSVNTRTGRLSCVLEENNCFDAEVYADEMDLEQPMELREDQRINLGKWVLRYLFANLIDQEIKRDEDRRKEVVINAEHMQTLHRSNAPSSIDLPASSISIDPGTSPSHESVTTPRVGNGFFSHLLTPSLSIGVATPANPPTLPSSHTTNLAPMAEEDSHSLEKKSSHQSQSGALTEGVNDYFSSKPALVAESNGDNGKTVSTPGAGQAEAVQSPSEPEKEEKSKESGSRFGKKFRMTFPKKLGGRPSVELKPVVTDEKTEESDKSSEKEEKVVDDNFFGTIQKLKYEYEEKAQAHPGQPLPSGICPSLPNETPILRLLPHCAIQIQEDRPDQGGISDVYRGSVGSVGQDADLIEQKGPMWLGDLLLRNQVPFKEPLKIAFVLLPYEDRLPSIASADGNARLNANRMLRSRKILSYVAERIEPQPLEPDPDAMKPEEYLELYCNGHSVPPKMTLATIRTYIWKASSDIILYYKHNDKKPSLLETHSDSKPEAEHHEHSLPGFGTATPAAH